MLRISGWKRQSVRKLAKPKNENSKTPIAPRNRTNQKRNESLSKTETILRAYDRQINQHLMISKECFLVAKSRSMLDRFQPIRTRVQTLNFRASELDLVPPIRKLDISVSAKMHFSLNSKNLVHYQLHSSINIAVLLFTKTLYPMLKLFQKRKI